MNINGFSSFGFYFAYVSSCPLVFLHHYQLFSIPQSTRGTLKYYFLLSQDMIVWCPPQYFVYTSIKSPQSTIEYVYSSQSPSLHYESSTAQYTV